jgi:membrane protein implicated in regulation of membrane protease activity
MPNNNDRAGEPMTLALVLWLAIGALLIGGELMTGTFYLLIFGVAAWIGGALAFFGAGLDIQLAVAGASAIAGLFLVIKYGPRWRQGGTQGGPDLDIGNEVRVETAEGPRLKVFYRGSVWDAVVDSGDVVRAGEIAVIQAVRGITLVVRPAARR